MCVLLLAASRLAAQGGSAQSPGIARVPLTIPPGERDTLLLLPHSFLEPGSDTLRTASGFPCAGDSLYVLDHRQGRLLLRPRFLPAAAADSAGIRVIIFSYRYLPLRFGETYRRRALAASPDTARGDSIRVATPVRPQLGLDDIFGRGLQKSGSIFRGFTVGSTRELSLSSGFRMQLAGRIGSDLDITAALTDETTPIQPEGTTQTLQEFDRVFVDFRTPVWGVTLGDFVFSVDGGEFARVTRKLQGAQAEAHGGVGVGPADALLAGASTKGKFHSNQFDGVEGVQGPYTLIGRNGERSIVVVAGTERVYVNGERMVRGETNDYVIDYGTAEIRFTARRLITGASRLVVDFEYADRQYARSILGGSAGTAVQDSSAEIRFTYLREADDPDAPIDLDLPDSLRAIIAAAGGNPDNAVVSGVRRVDSNGVYIRIDTLLAGGLPREFYRYAPGDPAAVYLVTFSDVGAERGEYIRRGPGEFEFRGPGLGTYLPVIPLPLAQGLDLLAVAGRVRPVAGLTLEGEFAGSSFNPNRISTTDVTLRGNAWKAGAEYTLPEIRLGDAHLGRLTFGLKERRVQEDFTPADRTTEIEFGRAWALDSLTRADERITEASLDFRSPSAISVRGFLGSMKRGEEFQSKRTEGLASWAPPGGGLRYRVENIRSTDSRVAEQSTWWRHLAGGSMTAGILEPGLRIEAEDRMILDDPAGTVRPGSFAYRLVSPRLLVREAGPVSLNAEFEWRTDDAVSGGERRRESRSMTQAYGARLTGVPSLAGAVDLTFRDRTYEEEFATAGAEDVRSILVQSTWRYAPASRAIEADILYHALTERSALLERVFVRVPPGTGSYRYLGDLNGNGIADEGEFEQVRFDGDFIAVTLPSDELTPVIDVRTSFRLRVQGGRLVGPEPGLFTDLVRSLSTETYVRVEEKSTEKDLHRIYLLQTGSFQNDSTTLAGSLLFTQDILVRDGDPDVSGRLRFQERKALTRLGSGVERQYSRERSLRLRWQPLRELSQQWDLVVRDDNLGGAGGNARARSVSSSGISLDLSYRPEQQVEFGMRFDVSRAEDDLPEAVQTADLNTQTARLVYSFRGSGQGRLEFAREEILLRTGGSTPVYELTGGRVEGRTWIWRGGLEYRLAQFIQASASYEGRAEGGRPPVHSARAEVRAYF